ncbi:hypothetical protein SPHINGO8BC_51481 [Sphingobacterium multivorum]|uniref:Uncharacterized protein n=1 Tax=Sphingobacterium multivorum TaxID=28454 RepID=A0A654D2K5_SPHMU|nr:hypothetical protein SPHINGO8BC_51481 [Sphingobacterium multivorum]
MKTLKRKLKRFGYRWSTMDSDERGFYYGWLILVVTFAIGFASIYYHDEIISFLNQFDD